MLIIKSNRKELLKYKMPNIITLINKVNIYVFITILLLPITITTHAYICIAHIAQYIVLHELCKCMHLW